VNERDLPPEAQALLAEIREAPAAFESTRRLLEREITATRRALNEEAEIGVL
jgi:hypothetical protein